MQRVMRRYALAVPHWRRQHRAANVPAAFDGFSLHRRRSRGVPGRATIVLASRLWCCPPTHMLRRLRPLTAVPAERSVITPGRALNSVTADDQPLLISVFLV